MEEIKPYRGLVLSGGGIKGVAHLGALHSLESRGLLRKVRFIACTSIGSAIGVLISLGWKPYEIHQIFKDLTWTNYITKIDLRQFLQEYGMLDIDKFFRKLEELLLEKFPAIPTLSEVADRYRIRLCIATYNLTENRMEYLHPSTHPGIDVLTAVKMSCALPIVFPSVEYMGRKYIDGGILDNFPFSQIPRKMRTLGIDLATPSQSWDDANLFEYLYRISQIASNHVLNTQLENLPRNVHRLHIDTGIVAVSLQTAESAMRAVFQRGYDEMERFLTREKSSSESI